MVWRLVNDLSNLMNSDFVSYFVVSVVPVLPLVSVGLRVKREIWA